jgi:2-keto-4-pentenoate hydratase/2-oxohepta-3-ene-1,7-dioic acid hydratase in catechol pathway
VESQALRVARVALEDEPSPRAAIVSPDGEHLSVLDATVTVLDLLGDPNRRAQLSRRVSDELQLADVRLLAPVEPPAIRDFSAFEQHLEGTRLPRNPEQPVPPVWYAAPGFYFSNPHALTGPAEDIALPPGCACLDFELEVAAVIGQAGTNLRPEEAGAYIAGYAVFNDWSARDIQLEEMKLGLGPCKGKDFANTLGPWVVTADELEDRRRGDRLDLKMTAAVNGRELGSDTLAHMAWSFEELISYASRGAWVAPGDVLGSGTCGGGCLLELWGRHGRQHHPPLAPGDTVSLTVEGIGTLANTVVAGVDPVPLPPARRRAEL